MQDCKSEKFSPILCIFFLEGKHLACVLNTTLCDKVCHWLGTDRWFSPGTPVSSTSKADHDDKA